MYNVIITGEDGAWDSREYELPRDRFCEFTSPQIKARFESLSHDVIEELKKLPTVFAYEGMSKDVRIGSITNITDRGQTIFFEFDFDWSIPPIPFAQLEPLRGRLDLKNRFEMTRTHWAIKNEDLLSRLAAGGLIGPGPGALSIGLPRASIPEPTTWSKLGAGGFGTVYRITDLRLGMDFALKVFDPSPFIAKHVDARERFLREAGLLFRLHHEHVIRIHDASELPDGRPYIRMEYFAGKDLQRHSEDRPFTSLDSMSVVHRLASALGHAHERSIVHRDLKPSNVLVTDELDDLRLIDFGLGIVVEEAVARARLTTSSQHFGSPFASPELLANPKSMDPRNDIYSLGAIWFWMLAGRSPMGVGIDDVIQEFDLPARARNVLRSCLMAAAKRPAANEVADGLGDVLRPHVMPDVVTTAVPDDEYLTDEGDLRSTLGLDRTWSVNAAWLRWVRNELNQPTPADGEAVRIVRLAALWMATHDNEWIGNETLRGLARMIFGLIDNVASEGMGDLIDEAIKEGVETGFLRRDTYDAWEPGMTPGSGMRSRFAITPLGRRAITNAGYRPKPADAKATRDF